MKKEKNTHYRVSSVMTALKYNHNSLLLIRASHLVPPLLFVVSMVPWVRITLPRQTRRKAQMFLHWSNKPCWISARLSPRAPSPSSQLQHGFPYGFGFFFLVFSEQEWGSLIHSSALGTSHVLLSTSSGKRSHFYYVGKQAIPILRRTVWGSFKLVQCHGCQKRT